MESGEKLRGHDATPEGVHLEEPDAFPHVVMGKLALLVVALAGGAWLTYAMGGVAGLFIGALLFMFVVLPYVVKRMSRAAQVNRARDIEEELEVEAKEHSSPEWLAAHAVPPPSASEPRSEAPRR